MARSRRSQYRSSILPTIMMGVTTVSLLGLAGVAVAWGMGIFDSDPEPEVDRTGQLAFPALWRSVPAFERVSREHLMNPNTGQLNVVWLPEETAKVALRDLGDVMGRVLSRNKEAGMALTEADFLPKGTKPGASAGIPPGKFAATIPVTGIPGLEQLRHGDRFDLIVMLNKEDGAEGANGNTEPAAVFGGIKPPSLRVGQLSRQHGIKKLVTGGQLITLTQGEQQSTIGSSGLKQAPPPRPSGNRKNTTPKKITFAEIAIDEEEIGPLAEAISLATPMTCIVHSGRPEAEINEPFSREGLVPVITTSSNVPAYTELTDESLIDDASGQLHFYYFPPDRVPDHWLTDPTEVYGRVVSRKLRRGSPITEADLLPLGTKPGISAGVPPGMVAMAVKTEQIAGFGDLVQGDWFAIHAKVPAQAQRPIGNSWAQLQGGSLSPDTERFERMLNTGIREVVTQAIYLREADGAATIAVPDDRVAEVAQLIRDKSELFVVARGGEEQERDANSSHSMPPRNSQEATKASMMDGEFAPSAKKTQTLQLPSRQLASIQVNNPENADPVQIPILTREVEAFEELDVADFLDPASGEIRFVFFPPEQVKSDWITDVAELIDRVSLRRLKAGRAVSASDLAPPGAIPGPSAGISPGMRGVLVDSSQVEDLDLLRPGTSFAIVSSRSVNAADLGGAPRRTLSSSDAVAESAKLPEIGVAVAQPVASGVLFLQQVDEVERVRKETLTDRSTRTLENVLSGAQETEVQETQRIEQDLETVTRFVIAVPETQVAFLLSAIAQDLPLRVSIQANTSADSSYPGHGSSGAPLKNQFPRTYIREHFYGVEPPNSEVFISERVYPLVNSVTDDSHE